MPSNAHPYWQPLSIDKRARAAIKAQTARCIWFTGLPASGKSTLSNLLEQRLHRAGKHTYLLDGDNIRHGLSSDLGFSDADRTENIRRVAEVARLMVDAGLIVLSAFISPYRSERRFARSLFAEGEFIEVHVKTALDVCMQRDPKGLYARALRGEINNISGYDAPYEEPQAPEVVIDTLQLTAEQAADRLFAYLSPRDRTHSGRPT